MCKKRRAVPEFLDPLGGRGRLADTWGQSEDKRASSAWLLTRCVVIGRGGGIRTRDPLHPMQVRYQAALHPDEGRIIRRRSVAQPMSRPRIDISSWRICT